VVLVHGYGGRTSQWGPLAAALASAGFDDISGFAYRSFSEDIPTVARRLGRAIEDLVAVAGVDDVHLVGHSLGGVILRYAVCVEGLDPLVRSAVTIASPHGGSPLSPLGVGPAAAQLRCGSELLRRLDRRAPAGHARWIAFAAEADVVVPPGRAQVRPPALAAENIELEGEGHLTVLSSARLASLLVDRLCRAEANAAPTAA
jgi:pimeloyl-ACP methyl ester carboxylesterase